MKDRLELHVTLDAGREVECAAFLAEQTKGPAWQILVTLAAEICSVHEARAQGEGARVVVVSGVAAGSVLRDLGKAPALPGSGRAGD